MATITASASGGTRAWSDALTWTGGVIPGAGDDVLLASTSGAVSVTDARSCLTLDCTGYTSTLTIAAAITLTVAGTKFLLVAGMTLTLGSATTSALAFTKSSAGTVLITSGGKTLGNVTTASGLTVSSAVYQLQDASTIGATAVWTHNAGTLDTNGKAVSWGSLSTSNTNTRTLTFGASAITITAGGASWFASTVTGLTVTANTAIVTQSAANALFRGAFNWNGMSVVQSGSGAVGFDTTGGTYTFANYTRTPTAVKTDSLGLNANITCTGTMTLNSNSSVNRLLVQSLTLGTSRTITVATLVCTNAIDFQDITGAGAATWAPVASGATSFGDCLGNSGITFTTAAPQTWSGNTTGSASTAANWTSRVPLPQDNVLINALTSGTITLDMPRIGANLDCTGSTGGTVNLGVAATSYGNVTLVAAITWNTSANALTLAGRGSQTITSATRTWPGSLTISAVGGTYTLQDDISGGVTKTLSVNTGTFAGNGKNVTYGIWFTIAGATTNMGAGTWTLSGTGTIASNAGTINSSTSTIAVSDTSVTAKSFLGGGKVYNNLTITGGGTGALTISGNNTFNVLTVGAPKTLIMVAGSNNTVTNIVSVGSSGNLVTWTSGTPGTQYTLTSNTGGISMVWNSYKDFKAAGTATFFIGVNSTQVSNNTGLTATAPARTWSATQGQSGTFVNILARTYTATTASTATYTRTPARTTSASTASAAVAYTRASARVYSASTTATATGSRSMARTASASTTAASTIARAMTRTTSAATAISGALVGGRQLARTYSASLGSAGTATGYRVIVRSDIGGSATLGVVSRAMSRVLTANSTVAGSTLPRSLSRTYSAAQTTSAPAAQVRQLTRRYSASTTLVGSYTHVVHISGVSFFHTYAASVGTASAYSRGLSVTLRASVTVTPFYSRYLAGLVKPCLVIGGDTLATRVLVRDEQTTNVTAYNELAVWLTLHDQAAVAVTTLDELATI